MKAIVMTLAVPDKTGAARMCWYFSKAFLESGYKVTVVHGPRPTNRAGTGEEEPSIIDDLNEIGARTELVSGLAFPLRAKVAGEVAGIARAEEARCIIGIMQRDRAVALHASHRLRIPGMFHLGNQHIFWGPWPVPWLKRMYYKNAVRRFASHVVCTSDVVRDELVRDFDVAKERTTVLPNGIDVDGSPRLDAAERRRIRESFGIGDDELMMINVGRIDAQKGQDVLLDALSQVDLQGKKIRLLIVGDVTPGSNSKRAERFRRGLLGQIEEHQMQDLVVFTGFRDDVAKLLGAADGYVHSARWEGPAVPLSVMEGMGASLPVVTTNCSGWPQGFENGRHGYVVEKGDAAELRDALQRIIGMTDDERRRMGEAARELLKEFYDIRQTGARFVEIVEDVLGKWRSEQGEPARGDG